MTEIEKKLEEALKQIEYQNLAIERIRDNLISGKEYVEETFHESNRKMTNGLKNAMFHILDASLSQLALAGDKYHDCVTRRK